MRPQVAHCYFGLGKLYGRSAHFAVHPYRGGEVLLGPLAIAATLSACRSGEAGDQRVIREFIGG
jgi:hypothetical protein